MDARENELKADLVLSNCSQLVTCRKEAKDLVGIIEDGWIAVKGDRIIALGSKEEVCSKVDYSKAEVIDCKGKVVAPGFVDCHTHLVFGGSRVKEYVAKLTVTDSKTLEEMGIETGIMVSVNMTRDSSEEELYKSAYKRIYNMMCSGTTTVESKSGYGLCLEHEIKMLKVNKALHENLPIDIISTFLGAHGWPDDVSKDKYIDILTEEMIPYVAEKNLAKFCDVWCDEGYYTAKESEKILKRARDLGIEPRIHTDAYSYIGGSDLAAHMNFVSADHLNYTPREVIKKLSKAKVTGVLLPVTDFAVKHPKPFDPRPMIEEGMTIALATNCCPGAWIESMQFIMMLACRAHSMTPAEALRAATLGGAYALSMEEEIGSLEVGKLGDMQIWNTSNYEDVVYKFGGNMVEKVIKRGKVIIDRK
ncbi:MAG: imidazolonepropionase [Clostridiaceae bacterium]